MNKTFGKITDQSVLDLHMRSKPHIQVKGHRLLRSLKAQFCLWFISRYDHLTHLITSVLEETPEAPIAVDNLESLSTAFKTSRMKTELNFKNVKDEGRHPGLNQAEWTLFKVSCIQNPVPSWTWIHDNPDVLAGWVSRSPPPPFPEHFFLNWISC